MIEWGVLASYMVCGALLAMMAIGVAFSAFMPALDRWNRRYFIAFFSLLFLYVVVLVVDMIIYDDPAMVNALIAVSIAEFLLFSVLALLPTFFLLRACGESVKGSPLPRAVAALWGVFCLMLFSVPFTETFGFVTPECQFVRGPWFPALIAPLAVIMCLNIAGLIRRRRKLKKKIFIVQLVYLLPTAIMIAVYMFAAVDIIVAVWMVLSALTMFGFIISDNMEQYMRQQREIANQRANVMVLQMRPHFIYNTMMTIYCLCKQDADKARQVTLDFTNYLRRNFTAIGSENVIPFRDELEHTRAYLAVEQAQFEDCLFVRFDTPHTMFRVPPLTLQPIVENAVKHGMKSSGEPLHITVFTRLTDEGSEIAVEDDGVGFAPAEDGKPHTALKNIRQRLALMCGGRLEISPREGGGTTVKVTIPAEK